MESSNVIVIFLIVIILIIVVIIYILGLPDNKIASRSQRQDISNNFKWYNVDQENTCCYYSTMLIHSGVVTANIIIESDHILVKNITGPFAVDENFKVEIEDTTQVSDMQKTKVHKDTKGGRLVLKAAMQPGESSDDEPKPETTNEPDTVEPSLYARCSAKIYNYGNPLLFQYMYQFEEYIPGYIKRLQSNTESVSILKRLATSRKANINRQYGHTYVLSTGNLGDLYYEYLYQYTSVDNTIVLFFLDYIFLQGTYTFVGTEEEYITLARIDNSMLLKLSSVSFISPGSGQLLPKVDIESTMICISGVTGEGLEDGVMTKLTPDIIQRSKLKYDTYTSYSYNHSNITGTALPLGVMVQATTPSHMKLIVQAVSNPVPLSESSISTESTESSGATKSAQKTGTHTKETNEAVKASVASATSDIGEAEEAESYGITVDVKNVAEIKKTSDEPLLDKWFTVEEKLDENKALTDLNHIETEQFKETGHIDSETYMKEAMEAMRELNKHNAKLADYVSKAGDKISSPDYVTVVEPEFKEDIEEYLQVKAEVGNTTKPKKDYLHYYLTAQGFKKTSGWKNRYLRTRVKDQKDTPGYNGIVSKKIPHTDPKLINRSLPPVAPDHKQLLVPHKQEELIVPPSSSYNHVNSHIPGSTTDSNMMEIPPEADVTGKSNQIEHIYKYIYLSPILPSWYPKSKKSEIIKESAEQASTFLV